MVFHPSLPTLYVTNSNDNTVSAFSYTPSGDFSALGAPVATGDLPAGMGIPPSGNLLYVSNFRSNTISGYKVEADGTLSELSDSPYAAGAQPQFQGFHPSGAFAFIANHGSDSLHTYRIEASGTLIYTSTVSGIDGPRGIAISNNGNVLYLAAQVASQVFAFTIDSTTGDLAPASGSPYPSGLDPWSVVLTP